jgi:acyl carrier protein
MASDTNPGTPGNRETEPPAASMPQDHAESAATSVETESEAVCRLAAQLAGELDPHRKNLRVELDSSLERDLGFDSLARVELLARLERAGAWA